MTGDKAYLMMEDLKEVFDIVRLVDAAEAKQYTMNEKGEVEELPEKCFSVWKKDGRCDNCISSKVFNDKKQMSKFEYIKDEMYFVTSKYVEIDDKPYALEMVSHIQDSGFLKTYGREELAQQLSNYNWKSYLDPLTGVRNRTYYEEYIATFNKLSAIAVIDIDHFHSVNETFGTQAGDEVLRQVVNGIRSCVRKTDTIVRYDKDEFVLVFTAITLNIFKMRLEQIRQTIEELTVEEYPDIHITVSIGGVFVRPSSKDILEKAQSLLRQAKETRNAIVIDE